MKLLSKLAVPTESEAAANHAGMNTFFGAVLGFVMAGTEKLEAIEFSYVLFLTAGVVISILYISASRLKFIYSLLTVGMILMLPRAIQPFLEEGETLPDKLQPTLLVWTALTILVEFMPRRAEDPDPSKAEA